MSATLQRKMVLNDKPTLVLSDVNGARLELPGHDEDDIVMLIEEGQLEFAWNIALSPDKRREFRIFPECISWYKRTQGKERMPVDIIACPPNMEDALRTEAIISRLLGQLLNASVRDGRKPFITSKRLSLLFNCGTTHIINLIYHKRLAVIPGTSWGRGQNGAALVTVSSIVSFLKSRPGHGGTSHG